jgi:hypothetical protein
MNDDAAYEHLPEDADTILLKENPDDDSAREDLSIAKHILFLTFTKTFCTLNPQFNCFYNTFSRRLRCALLLHLPR